MSKFSHLNGGAKKTTAAKADESVDDDAKKTKKAKGASKADEGGDTTDPEDNEDEKKDKLDDLVEDHVDDEDDGDQADPDDADRAKKAKKAKAENADDDDEKDKKDAKASAARGRERARCAAIFSAPAAGRNPAAAAELAFNTDLSRKSAIGTLNAISAGMPDAPASQTAGARSDGLRARMEGTPQPALGPDVATKPAGGPSGFAAAVIQADKIRRGEA